MVTTSRDDRVFREGTRRSLGERCESVSLDNFDTRSGVVRCRFRRDSLETTNLLFGSLRKEPRAPEERLEGDRGEGRKEE